MTYMVMEVHQSYCVLLDEEGRFLKAANMGYQTGQRIGEAILLRDTKAPYLSRRALAAWTAAAACLLLALGGLWRMESAVTGSVYLSINPGIRMDVNRSDKVMALAGLNAEGKALTADYDYRRKDMNTAAEELVDRAIVMGYLQPGAEIVIELSGEEAWEQTAGQSMEDRLESHLAGKMEAAVIFGEEPTPAPVPAEAQRAVIEIPALPAATPTPKSAPRRTAAQAEPTPQPYYGDSGYGTTIRGDSGYDGDSGYSGYGGTSGYDGSS